MPCPKLEATSSSSVMKSKAVGCGQEWQRMQAETTARTAIQLLLHVNCSKSPSKAMAAMAVNKMDEKYVSVMQASMKGENEDMEQNDKQKVQEVSAKEVKSASKKLFPKVSSALASLSGEATHKQVKAMLRKSSTRPQTTWKPSSL